MADPDKMDFHRGCHVLRPGSPTFLAHEFEPECPIELKTK